MSVAFWMFWILSNELTLVILLFIERFNKEWIIHLRKKHELELSMLLNWIKREKNKDDEEIMFH